MKFTHKILMFTAFGLTFGLSAGNENPFHELHAIVSEANDENEENEGDLTAEKIEEIIINEIRRPHSNFYEGEEPEVSVIELIRQILAQNVSSNVYSHYKDLKPMQVKNKLSEKWEDKLVKILEIEKKEQFETDLSNLIKTEVTAFYEDRIKKEDPKGIFASRTVTETAAAATQPSEKSKGNKKKYIIAATILVIAAGVGYWWYNSAEEN